MISDFKRSIQLVLSERIASPFAGAFLFSWLVWNWRLLYYLFILDNKFPLLERLSYVDTHFINIKCNLIYPFLSAVFLIVIYPFITTGSLWVWLKFRKWQVDLKNQVERETLLTLEQSLALRLKIQSQQEKFDRLLRSKDDELALLKGSMAGLQTQYDELVKLLKSKDEEMAMLNKNFKTQQGDLDQFMKIKDKELAAISETFQKEKSNLDQSLKSKEGELALLRDKIAVLQKQKDELEQIVKSRNTELTALKETMRELGNQIESDKNKFLYESRQQDQLKREIDELLSNQLILKYIPGIMTMIQGGYSFRTQSIPPDVVGTLVAYDIIQRKAGSESLYDFTNKGKVFLREYTKRKLP